MQARKTIPDFATWCRPGRPSQISLPGAGQEDHPRFRYLVQARKTIPDFATWSQCFAIYTAVRVGQEPERLADPMGYMTLIAKASRRYNWPAWVIYDQQLRQDAAGNPGVQWAKADPSLYAQCFTGQDISKENWCSSCQELDHKSADCPYRSRKRSWNAAYGHAEQLNRDGGTSAKQKQPQVCLKFNRYDGECRYGRECKFVHACIKCKGPHPASKCTGQ